MDAFNGFYEAVAKAEENFKMNDGDYTDTDGLVHCGVCHRAKQARVNALGKIIITSAVCDCRLAELDEQDKLDEIKAKERNKKEREKGLAGISLTSRGYESINFDEYKNTKTNQLMLRAAQKYLAEYESQPDLGLIFCGQVGTGKTYTGICIIKEMEKRGISAIATSFMNIFNQDISERDEIIRKILKHKVIMIDDLNAERSTEYAQEIIYTVIDTACRKGKSLILTTNKTKEQMANSGNIQMQRIYDRILSVCIPIETKGASIRPYLGKSRRDAFMQGLEQQS